MFDGHSRNGQNSKLVYYLSVQSTLLSKMPSCSQCDSEAVSQCNTCSKPFCGNECYIKGQCCIGSAITWPRNIKDKWIASGVTSEDDFKMLREHGREDNALASLMKGAGPKFFAFKFSTQENTITAMFGGGKTDRLVVWISESGEHMPSIRSTNTEIKWKSLDAVRQWYFEKDDKEFEVKIQEISQVVV